MLKICSGCHKEFEPTSEYKVCDKCREYFLGRSLEWHKEKRKLAAASGNTICSDCFKPKEPDKYKLCDSCREKSRIRNSRHSEKHHTPGVCTLCHKPKLTDQYKMCEPCRVSNREYVLEWNKSHPKQVSESRKIRNRANRLAVLQHYSNSNKPTCSCCGEPQIEFLCLDHINGGGRAHRTKVGWGARYNEWLMKAGYPEGLRVLCHNCNQSYGAYGYCPHKGDEQSA